MERDLVVQTDRLHEAEAARQGIVEQKSRTDAEFRHSVLDDLTRAQDKANSLAQELVKAEQHMHEQTLTAPVDGVVQQLAVHTVGGVVTPAQTLMVIVPADSHLEIEAMISNQDIGFVHAGQRAEVKVDTFNFTRYGLLHGTVVSVSRDAVEPEAATQTTRGAQEPTQDASHAQQNHELAYAARISLEQTNMEVDGQPVDLKPGMVVSAEINTGTRRVIDYLLSPLLRYRADSMHER
jgi:hemolysin D